MLNRNETVKISKYLLTICAFLPNKKIQSKKEVKSSKKAHELQKILNRITVTFPLNNKNGLHSKHLHIHTYMHPPIL